MKVVVLATLLGVANGLLMPEYTLPDVTIQTMAVMTKPSELLVVTPCIPDIWSSCQKTFNTQLGMDPTLTYLNGTLIFNTVNNLLAVNTTTLVNICNQRTQFYQCFGTSYFSCMYLFNVLQQPGADYQNAFDYMRTYMSLDFMCNAGFEEVVNEWSCLHGVQTTMGVQNCLKNFNETVNPSVLCPTVQSTGSCLYNAYEASCVGKAAGFFGCENFRYTFDQVCYNLRCNVV